MYEYCSAIIKKYSKYTIPSLAPKGFYSMLEPPQIDKWQHLSANCTLQFQVLLEDSGQVVIHVILNSSTFLEHIRLPLSNNHDLIQFSCKCPIISCKYISEEFGLKMLKRFQINLPNEVEFNRIVISLKNLNFIMKTVKTSIARNTMINQVLDIGNSKKANFIENNKFNNYTNANTRFQTQNTVMDFSQHYLEESGRKLSNCSNMTLPLNNFPIAQQNWSNTDMSEEQFSQDFSTPLATQVVPSRPIPLNVQLVEPSQLVPNATSCPPIVANNSIDIPLRRENTLCNTKLLEVAALPTKQSENEGLSQIQTTVGTVKISATTNDLEKKDIIEQNINDKEKVGEKLNGSPKTEHVNTSRRKVNAPSIHPFNETMAETTLIQAEMTNVKKASRETSRKISKRLIKERLKDEKFMKWVCIHSQEIQAYFFPSLPNST